MSFIRAIAVLLSGLAVTAALPVAAQQPPPPRVAGAAGDPVALPASTQPPAENSQPATAAPESGAVAVNASVPSGTESTKPLGTSRFGLMVGADFEFGGDSVATLSFTNGDTQDVEAGQGITLGAGVYWRQYDEQGIEVRGKLGYKLVTTAATNADITLTRIVSELTSGYRFGSGIWVGGGLVHHSNIKFDADGFGENIDFDNATGYTIEVGWRWLSASYTGMDYKDTNGNDYDASNFGVSFNWQF